MKSFMEEYGKIVVAAIIIMIFVVIASPLGTALKDGVKKTVTTFEENNPAYFSQILLLNENGQTISTEQVKNNTEFTLEAPGADQIWIRKSGDQTDTNWNRSRTFTVDSPQTFQLVTGWEFGKENKSDVYAILFEDGTLQIGGAGEADTRPGYSDGFPWYQHTSEITSVEFLNNVTVTSIEKWFANFPNLTTVKKLPDSVKNMKGAFLGCKALVTACDYPANVEDISSSYYQCGNLETGPSSIPNSVTNGSYAFYECKKLKTTPVISPDSNLEDVRSMFSYAPIVTAPTIPRNVKKITGFIQYCDYIEGELNCYATSFEDVASYNKLNSYTGKAGSGITVNYTNANADKIDTWFSWYKTASQFYYGKCTKGSIIE